MVLFVLTMLTSNPPILYQQKPSTVKVPNNNFIKIFLFSGKYTSPYGSNLNNKEKIEVQNVNL